MFILFTIPSCIGFSHRKTKASPKYMLECCIKISLGKFTNMLILVTWEEGPWVASAKGGTFHSLLFNTFWILNYALGWPKSSFGCFQMTLQKKAIIMELSCEESCCSAGNNQAAEQAGITQQSWQLSSR